MVCRVALSEAKKTQTHANAALFFQTHVAQSALLPMEWNRKLFGITDAQN